MIIATILIFINLLGTGIIFDISKENVYTRGPMNFILYIFVFVYYIESIYTVQKAKADSILVEFFPIYYFIIPCMIVTMIQGFFFRISMVWLCVAIAFILVYIEIQISISFIDDVIINFSFALVRATYNILISSDIFSIFILHFKASFAILG